MKFLKQQNVFLTYSIFQITLKSNEWLVILVEILEITVALFTKLVLIIYFINVLKCVNTYHT